MLASLTDTMFQLTKLIVYFAPIAAGSLYLSIAAIFAAQASGISLGGEAAMLATLMVTSKGIAGVPRAVLAILLGTAASFHLSTAAVMMVLGVDALIDMGRTRLNVGGNCLASAVVNRWEPAAEEMPAREFSN